MVLQSYVDALKKDGVIVVPAVSLDEYPQSREALNKTYTNARTGKRYKIERQPQSNNSVWVLGKVLIK
jgi:hypothetical protein